MREKEDAKRVSLLEAVNLLLLVLAGGRRSCWVGITVARAARGAITPQGAGAGGGTKAHAPGKWRVRRGSNAGRNKVVILDGGLVHGARVGVGRDALAADKGSGVCRGAAGEADGADRETAAARVRHAGSARQRRHVAVGGAALEEVGEGGLGDGAAAMGGAGVGGAGSVVGHGEGVVSRGGRMRCGDDIWLGGRMPSGLVTAGGAYGRWMNRLRLEARASRQRNKKKSRVEKLPRRMRRR